MKTRLTILLGLLAAFLCGYASAEPWKLRATAYERGTQEAIWYIEDCTLEDAHAQRCTIPCSTDLDCVQKNGTRGAY